MTTTIQCSIARNSNSNPPCKSTISGIATCPECGHKMCPICFRHEVTQLSRVTGYIQDVSGFNMGKQQELKDRKHYNI